MPRFRREQKCARPPIANYLHDNVLKQIGQREIVANHGRLVLIVPITRAGADVVHCNLLAICFGYDLRDKVKGIPRDTFYRANKLFEDGALCKKAADQMGSIVESRVLHWRGFVMPENQISNKIHSLLMAVVEYKEIVKI